MYGTHMLCNMLLLVILFQILKCDFLNIENNIKVVWGIFKRERERGVPVSNKKSWCFIRFSRQGWNTALMAVSKQWIQHLLRMHTSALWVDREDFETCVLCINFNHPLYLFSLWTKWKKTLFKFCLNLWVYLKYITLIHIVE